MPDESEEFSARTNRIIAKPKLVLYYRTVAVDLPDEVVTVLARAARLLYHSGISDPRQFDRFLGYPERIRGSANVVTVVLVPHAPYNETVDLTGHVLDHPGIVDDFLVHEIPVDLREIENSRLSKKKFCVIVLDGISIIDTLRKNYIANILSFFYRI